MTVYENVVKYCAEKKISIRAFEDMCEIGNGTVGRWKEGSNPSLKTLEKIASHTGINLKKWIS